MFFFKLRNVQALNFSLYNRPSAWQAGKTLDLKLQPKETKLKKITLNKEGYIAGSSFLFDKPNEHLFERLHRNLFGTPRII